MSLDVTLFKCIKCPDCGCAIESGEELFDANITHNLNKMAEAAGIYMEVWRPEEIGIDRAHQLISPLKKGLRKLKENPGFYRILESANGWGKYDNFVLWLEEYLKACKNNPDAFVKVNR